MSQNFAKEISNEALNALPLKQFSGNIVVVEDLKSAETVSKILRSQRVLGFDTESKPMFRAGARNKIALLQLATNDAVFLIKTIKIGLPDCIAQILADENIVKAGAAVKDDVNGLRKFRSFDPKSFVELQKLSAEFGISDNSLKKMTGIVLGFRISKSEQLSNWEAPTLTESQKRYAATDAWVGLRIYKSLVYGE